MKRIYALTAAAAGISLSLMAQSKFDLPAAQLINNAKESLQLKAKSRSGEHFVALPKAVDAEQPYMVIVTLAKGHKASELAAMGYDTDDTESRFALTRLTAAEMQKVAEMDFVENISLGYEAEPMLNTARKETGVDEIHTGCDATNSQSFTGSGVIAGLMDIGMDVNHVNFLDESKNPRAKRLWVIQSASSVVTSYTTEKDIKAYTTDDEENTHATHVLGIMAGSFNDKPADRNSGKIAYINDRGSFASVSTVKMPYYGVAKNAEPAICIGTLEGNNIQVAVQKVTEYAKEAGKPAVMNLSLGNNRGPHDGTDAASQKLAEYGKDVLICISAGNEGDYNMSLNKKFTASDNELKTTIATSATAGGYVDIWGDNAQVLSVTFVAINKKTGDILYQYELNRNTQGESVTITGNAYTAPGYIHDEAFNSAFGSKGAITLSSNLSTTNNRYNVYALIQLAGNSTDIVPGFIVKGNAGNGVNMFAGAQGNLQFRSNGLAGYVNGNNSNSINGMACGDNVLVVGSYNNSIKVPTLGGLGTYSGTKGDISSFSSFGTTFQGRQLPDIVGPGMGMISSYSKYYISANNMSDNSMTAWILTDSRQGTKDYWGEMSGTSMSSPFVAGVLALWSEAALTKGETLTMDRVKEILKKTADHDEFTAQQPERWGMGKINALAGLKEILGTDALNSVGADDPEKSLIIEDLGGKRYNVFVGGTDGFTANLYNMQGVLTASVAADGTTAEVDASSLSDGIYLLEVQGKNVHTSRKIVVK